MLSTDRNIKRYFAVQLRTFGSIGIDFNQKDDILVKPWLAWLLGLSTALHMIGMLHFSWAHLTELDEVTDAMTPFLQCVLALWKLYIFLPEHKNMLKLVERLASLISQATESELAVINKANASIHFYNNFYFSSVTCTGSLALIGPIVVGLLSYFRKGEWYYVVPVKATYLLDYTIPLNYSFVFLMTMVTVYDVVNSSVAIDSLYSWFVHNIVAQLKILRVKMAQVNTDLEQGATLEELDSALIHCFEYHQMIITLAEQLDTLFRPIIFVEFTLSALQVCFIAYQIGQGIALASLPFLCVFLLAVSVQLMIYSYGGERLQNESESIAMTMYDTLPWQKLPIKSRKLILFAMMRAHKQCKLTGIFFIVGFPQYLWVFRTAASYVTLLRSVDQKEDIQLVL